jgi:hypothetical protein
MKLRISTPEREGIYQGSRWLKFQVLCEAKELEALFRELRPFFIYPLTGLVDGEPITEETFLSEYGSWIETLKLGKVPDDRSLRKILAAALTDDPEALWLQEVPGKGYLAKIAKPLVQVQAHWFTYSDADGAIRPMSMGLNSIFWGIQFSYPGVYQDPKTMELKDAEKMGLFEIIRHWVRDNTRPTPFVIQGQRLNAPIRLGKLCFPWIGRHSQLIEQGIQIHGS